MQIDTMTEALLYAIKSDVRQRVDDIVDRAERAAMTLDSEQQVDQLACFSLPPIKRFSRFDRAGPDEWVFACDVWLAHIDPRIRC